MPKGLLQRCLQPLVAAAAVLPGAGPGVAAAVAAYAGSNGCDATFAFPGKSSTSGRECANL